MSTSASIIAKANNKPAPRPILIGGISGAGCSTALRALEDFHFVTVGKLPISLIENFIAAKHRDNSERIAILPEIKSENSLKNLLELIARLGRENFSVIFLDANNNTIVKRYSETRRPHPDFAGPQDKTLVEAINREREYLIHLKESADFIIDTSNLTVHDLKRKIADYVEKYYSDDRTIRVNFVSFGYKHGLPLDCDLIIDARFLPNPYFVEQFKHKTGLEEDVTRWVLDQPDTTTFINQLRGLLEFLIPKYAYEGKAYLNIGIGCTGGQHRSVVIVEQLASLLKKVPGINKDLNPTCYHRDINS